MLRLEPRQVAMEAQHDQRDVLRHPASLEGIDGAHDRKVRGDIRGRQQVVGARPGAGDEPQRGKPRSDSRR